MKLLDAMSAPKSDIKFARGFKLPDERDRQDALGDLDDVDVAQRAFLAASPLFKPVEKPSTPNDWLALYAEEGQTYPQFLEECPWIHERKVSKYIGSYDRKSHSIRERYPGGKIYLLQIGQFPPAAISPSFSLLREYAEIYLRIPVTALGVFNVTEVSGEMFLHIPEEVLQQKRSKRASRASKRQSAIKLKFRSAGDQRQLNCPSLLSELAKFIPSDGLCLIGLTMFDLYEAKPDLFVAGLASGRERVALFSFARYDPCLTFSPEFWHVISTSPEKALSRDERKRMVLGRSCKLLVHEIGHLFGLDHCIHYQCCMNGSGHLEEDFAQPMFLCPICLRKLYKLTNCDIKKRYQDMGVFFEKNQMNEEKEWIEQVLS